MGIFDGISDYFKGQKKKKIERAGKVIKNAKAIRDDRWASLEYLANDVNDPEVAVPLLLERFEFSLEHGINDTREKELAMKGIVKYKERAIPVVKSWLQTTNRIAWPIKVLKELGQEQVVVDCLKSALDFGDVSFTQHIVDKNYDILCYLRDYQIPESVEQISHFLNDPDERVRYAAAELLISQQTDVVREKLERFLADDSAENRRLRSSIIQLFIDRHWKVENPQQFQGRLTDSVRVNPEGYLVHA